MNTLKVLKADSFRKHPAGKQSPPLGWRHYPAYLLLLILLLSWPIAQYVLTNADATLGFIDPNIWLLLLFSLICFMMVVGLCWWLLQRFWASLGLPNIDNLVLQFKELSTWQQLGFYWLSFVSLLLAAVGVLSAVI